MSNLEKHSLEELEQALYRKKRTLRQQRLERLKEQGRVVDTADLAPPPISPPLPRPADVATGAVRRYTTTPPEAVPAEANARWRLNWRWLSNALLVLVEIGAVIGLVAVLVSLYQSVQELNVDAALAQQQAVAGNVAAVPTPTRPPLINAVVLPTGHRPPVAGRPPQPGEAGDIPEHLQPLLAAYVPPPLPTPSAEQPRLISIPAIGVNDPVVPGDDWEQLKKGVGHHIGSAMPGQLGNLVLSAHNDIYGEIFRHLDKLSPGDEVVVGTGRESYTYVVSEIQVVNPTDVWVMEPTNHASLTLISCYPYLINNKRIVVFGELVETGPGLDG
jgi:sortase A